MAITITITIIDLPTDIHDIIAFFLSDKDLIEFVCASRHIVVSAYLRRDRQRAYWKRNYAKDLARKGDLAGLQYLHGLGLDRGMTCNGGAMEVAAKNGHLAVVQFLHGLGAPCTDHAMYCATENGHLAMVEFLHSIHAPLCDYFSMSNAVQNGHLPVVQFLHSVGVPCVHCRALFPCPCGSSLYAMNWAAENGHVAVVAYLYGIGAPYTSYAKKSAYENGHLAVVEFLTFAIQNTRLRMAVKKWHLVVAQFFNRQ